MKKALTSLKVIVCLLVFLCAQPSVIFGQCNNADFESGDFTGWTGTNGQGTCTGTVLFGTCIGCLYPDPLQNAGILRGPDNAPPNYGTQFSHFIMSSGYDPNVGGSILPVVYPGGTYSARLGNMWVDDGSHSNTDAETMSYAFTVTPSNCNFTYHYAVALNNGSGHTDAEQPSFQIRMTDGSGNNISCASYDVNANTAATIGFTQVGGFYYKTWSSVLIPLNNYMGQNVKITFTTQACSPQPTCHGSHYCYAYVDCSCAPLQIVSSSPTICGGQNVTLTAPAGAGSYSWSGPGIVGSTTGQTVTVTSAGHYTVNMQTLATPPQTPCPFSLDTILPGAPGNPWANFTATSVCVGNPTTFTDASTPMGSVSAWAWDFDNNGTPDATTQNPTHTFPSAGTYPVRLVASWPPCLDDTTVNVVVSNAPTSSFTATGPLCAGQNSTITYTGNGAVGDSYTWNFDGGTVVSGSGRGPYQVYWSSGGTKNVTLTVISGNCSSQLTTVQVTVNPSSLVTVSPDVSICNGGSTVLTAGGATTYTWAPSTGLSSTSGASVTANPASTTTYSVTGTSAGCSDSASVTVTVGGVPTSAFQVNPTTVCAGVDVTVTYTGNAPGGATYTWDFDGATVVSGSGQGPYQVNWLNSGTMNVTLTVAVGTCVSPQSTIPVTVNAAPVVTVSPDVTICIGGNTTLTAGGATTYTWAPSTGLSSTSGASVTANPASTITYSVTGTSAGCPDSASVTVTVGPIPTSTFTASSPLCEGADCNVNYTGTGSANATYTWDFDGGIIVSGSGQGPYVINWPVTGSASTKNITLTVSLVGCTSGLTTVPVTLNASPTSTFTTASPVCTGQNSTITYTGTGTGAAIYTWGFDGGTVVTGSGSGPYDVNWPTAGTKNITLSVDENNCSSSSTNTVTVNDIPTSNFQVVSPVCAGANSDITYIGTASASANYTWNFAGGTVASGSGQGPYQVNWSTAGNNNITLSVDENGCTSTPTTMVVTVNDVPVSDAGADATYCSGGNAPLGAASTGGYTYAWSPATGLDNPTASNPNTSIANTTNAIVVTTYTVTTTNSNCSTTDAVDISVIPNPVAAFTPPAGQCFNGNSFSFAAGGTFIPTATFAWDFGAVASPTTSTAQNPGVTFSAPGSNTITLVITQNGCVSNTATNTVDIYPMPVANFVADTIIGCENLPVCFTDNSTTGTGSTYAWTFGDGLNHVLQSPCHTYAAPGLYTVSLQVTTADGCIDQLTVPDMITIIADPTAAFTMSSMVIQLPQTMVDIQNLSQNAVSYLWTFGTTGTSTATTPGNTVFTEPGSYDITLYAYNQLGCYDSVQHPVTVYQRELFFAPNVFTPNGDGNNDFFEVYGLKDGWKQFEIQIFDRWGEKVYESADMNFKWDGSFQGKDKKLMSSVFVYQIHLVYTNNRTDELRKGSVTLVR